MRIQRSGNSFSGRLDVDGAGADFLRGVIHDGLPGLGTFLMSSYNDGVVEILTSVLVVAREFNFEQDIDWKGNMSTTE